MISRLLLLFGIIAIFTLSSKGQTGDTTEAHLGFFEAKTLIEQGNFKTSVPLLQTAKQEFRDAKAYQREVESSLMLGEAYLSSNQVQKAGIEWREAEATHSLHLPDRYELKAQLANNLGVIAYYSQSHLQAISHFQIAKAIWDTSSTVSPESKASLISNLAVMKEAVGDLAGAYQMQREAEAIALTDSSGNRPQLTTICSNISHVLIELGDYEKALYYANRAKHFGLSFMDSLAPPMNAVYNNLGVALIASNDPEAYRSTMRTQRNLLAKIFPPGHRRFFLWQSNYANGLMRMGLRDEARKEFTLLKDRMLKTDRSQLKLFLLGSLFDYAYTEFDPLIFQDFMGEYESKANSLMNDRHQIPLSKYHSDRAMYELMNNQLDSASHAIQKAMQIGSRGFSSFQFDSNPEIGQVLIFLGFEEICYRKARIAMGKWERFRQVSDLKIALKTLELAIDIDQKKRMEQAYYRVGPAIKKRRKGIHGLALKVAFQLYEEDGNSKWLGKAFTIMERGRSIQLQDALNDHQAMHFAGIPDTLTQQTQEIRIALNHQRNQVRIAYETGNPSAIATAENEQINLLHRQDDLANEVHKAFPKFYELRFQSIVPAPDSVLAELSQSQTILIAFFEGLEDLYVLGADGHQFFKHQVPLEHLTPEVIRFKESINGTDFILNRKENYSDFRHSAVYLYAQLLAPLLAQMEIGESNRLLIIPDGLVQELPFSALLTKEAPSPYTDFRKLPYLLHDFSISYAYNMGLQKKIKSSSPSDQRGSGLVFAPEFTSKGTQLEGARQEGREVANLIGGEILEGRACSETSFRTQAPGQRILHFATHGKADLQVPARSFIDLGGDSEMDNSKRTEIDGKLQAFELLEMELDAELVVLSACETGKSSESTGEAPMSLVRAFRYAGCPSTVMSYWNIPDRESSGIIQDFYRGLKKGMPKDLALTTSKRNYLSQCQEDFAHPYYWASMVLTGDRKPIAPSHSQTGNIALLLILGGISYLIIRYSQSNRST